MPTLTLGLPGLSFRDLFDREGLARLDAHFIERLRAESAAAAEDLLAFRDGARPFTPLAVSALLLACAPVLEAVLAELFGIETALAQANARTLAHDPIFAFKKEFVQKRARRRLNAADTLEDFANLDAWLRTALGADGAADRELAIARFGLRALADADADAIERLTRWCVRALASPEGRAAVAGFVSFALPQALNYQRLIPVRTLDDAAGRVEGAGPRRARDGFALTDARMRERAVMNEVHYCIYCHDHDGDFCSKGFPQKKGEPQQGLKLNPLGSVLTGCPLDEKISEMHRLKRDGHTIAALAVAMIDNPMVPATGHRICNDCMKACIYQKQDPVNIPQIETRLLTDVLDLPWGVEIYDLLTRWNPLRPRQYLPKPYNGRKVLITGMGPAGFTLAHHLLMEGFAVVGIDGLKIEPLPEDVLQNPVARFADIKEDLDTRVMAGFGGVAEYGITVRWDKNFLTLIHLALSRRPRFQAFGGVRLGGTVTLDDAWALGFDHVSIATGTGLPKALPIGHSLARGMRQAVDFLMALQLTGAAKAASLTNLQVRLPAVVIGGGLTGIDTATEVQAYYIKQVEKILARYERLAHAFGEARVREHLDEESVATLNEFLAHGKRVRAERAEAARAGRAPDFLPLLRALGGVTVAYRRGMNESPAYLRNHEEIGKAFEEGIFYAEGLDPKDVRLDRFGHVEALVCRRQRRDADGHWQPTDEEVVLPARAIFVAAGSTPNTIYEREHPGTFAMAGRHFQMYEDAAAQLRRVDEATHCKAPAFGPFTSYDRDGKRVSFIGDTHPVFHGSVVKAIASALRAYPAIAAAAGGDGVRGDEAEYRDFRARMAAQFTPRVTGVRRFSPTVVEVRVRAPLAARNLRPGQFFRLQNFERRSALIEGTRLQTEALALTGVKADGDEVSLMVLEVGTSSRLCATLKPGDPLVLMGPTGKPTHIPRGETVLVLGGRRGAAVMRTLGPALRAAGNRVLYLAGFQTADEVYCQTELEAGADVVVWCTAAGEALTPRRAQDRALTAPYRDALARYAAGELHAGHPPIALREVDRILVIGTQRLLRLVREARAHELSPYLREGVEVIASVSSPMQCMLKGVCSQCLQWHVDPATGLRTRAVFSCAMQDQSLAMIDLDNLDARLDQNRLQERLGALWLDYLFAHNDVERV